MVLMWMYVDVDVDVDVPEDDNRSVDSSKRTTELNDVDVDVDVGLRSEVAGWDRFADAYSLHASITNESWAGQGNESLQHITAHNITQL